MIDDTLAKIDRSLAIDLPSTTAWFADHPTLSHLLWIAYGSSFVQLFGLVVFLAVLRREDKLWELVFVCSLTIFVSAAFSIVWPAIGAFAYFDYSTDILQRLPPGSGTYHLAKFDYFRSGSSPVISFASLQGVVTFPSFHCCLALMTIFAAVGIRWLFWTLTVWNALVVISTVPIGGHYVIDLAGGGLLWLIGVTLAITLSRLGRRERRLVTDRGNGPTPSAHPA
ncbi:phosphatase PAP2 family protein [Bradyrhizobium cosmicum]|uniref:phosphatase PAP2 family protein n=1 Tax=Bradyrhizobium cosmicum TaxID=1404864 RepID=UPI0028ECF024|nr:phosphatase PAP2 family protein [Bradyrhizobium cosmicum]